MDDTPRVKPLQRREMTTRRKWLFRCLTVLVGFALGGVACELFFRILVSWERAQIVREGTGFRLDFEPRWGWRLKPGQYRYATAEFDTHGFVNDLYLNDGQPYDADEDAHRTRILALGDSHTAAVGASTDETWANVLEERLGTSFTPQQFRSYNAGVWGYSLHQYLLRLIDQGPQLRPHYVVVGYCFATDLYDLLPPSRGGWAYGPERARAYFDLDESGRLVEKHFAGGTKRSPNERKSKVRIVREILENFATFDYLRKTKLALAIGSRVTIGGQSLWPNMDVVTEKEISAKHEYQWQLTKALLIRMKEESAKLDAQLIIVGIPYLPQVYDEIWDATFGGKEAYSRTAAPERLAKWCQTQNIAYVETLDAFRKAVSENGCWLHHRKDAHPTAAGHALIADTVLDSGLIEPAKSD